MTEQMVPPRPFRPLRYGSPVGQGAPLLRVENIVKHFEISGGLLGISRVSARYGPSTG